MSVGVYTLRSKSCFHTLGWNQYKLRAFLAKVLDHRKGVPGVWPETAADLEVSFRVIVKIKSMSQIDLFQNYSYSKEIVKLATLVEGDPKAPFSLATTPRFREGATP